MWRGTEKKEEGEPAVESLKTHVGPGKKTVEGGTRLISNTGSKKKIGAPSSQGEEDKTWKNSKANARNFLKTQNVGDDKLSKIGSAAK